MFFYICCRATRLAGIGIALFFLITQAFGTTYYVSSSTGSNSNSGTDTGHPWQTITKVSSPGLSYAAGDFILFKCGDTWTNGVGTSFTATLTTPNSGTSGHPITYGHYVTSGSCTIPPIIDGNGNLGYLMQITKDYVTLDGLQLQNSSSALVTFTGRTGTYVLNSTLKNGGLRGLYATFGTCSTTIDNNIYTVDPGKTTSSNIVEIWTGGTCQIVVTNNVFDRSQAAGASAGLSVVLPGANNALIQYNTIHGGGQGVGVKPYQQSDGSHCNAGDPDTHGNVIADNYIDGVSRYGSSSIDGELIEMEGCSGNDQKNTTIARNVLMCLTGTSLVGSSDAIGGFFSDTAEIYGNIVMGGCQTGTPTSTPRAFAFNSNSVNMHVYNNTIVGVGRGPDNRTYIGILFTPGSNGIVKNNIFKNYPVGLEGTSTEDYNIFDTDVTTPYSGSGMTHGGHSQINTHPGFVSSSPAVANDVKLQVGAAGIGAGLNLGPPYNVILDQTAIAEPYGPYDQSGGTWMAGAFGPPGILPPPPVALTITGARVTGGIVIPQ